MRYSISEIMRVAACSKSEALSNKRLYIDAASPRD